MGVAFIDLDRTLIAKNSGTLWIRREFREGHLGLKDSIHAMALLARYSLGLLQADGAVRAAVASLKGLPRAPFEARTDLFFQQEVLPLVRPGARRSIAEHRARGDQVVLLTSSSNYMASRARDALHLDGFLCTTLEVDADDKHTGQTVGPPCFGVGKLHYARGWSETHGVPLAEATFYTDSYSDLSVLEVVGHPVVIDPDRRLRREARRRGWPVVDWGEPDRV